MLTEEDVKEIRPAVTAMMLVLTALLCGLFLVAWRAAGWLALTIAPGALWLSILVLLTTAHTLRQKPESFLLRLGDPLRRGVVAAIIVGLWVGTGVVAPVALIAAPCVAALITPLSYLGDIDSYERSTRRPVAFLAWIFVVTAGELGGYLAARAFGIK